ncbi:formylglycine-generating enzyme family protein [Chloroflexi bacterium]|nr:formylglycine-generating enzyme family protein [Chloroflexota bacterium]
MTEQNSEQMACCAASRDTKLPLTVTQNPQSFPAPAGSVNSKNMAAIKGGMFLMGSDYKFGFPGDGEGPIQEVKLNPFLMDVTAVTNKNFANFVKETGYRTDAEKFGWSFVFYKFISIKNLPAANQSPPGTPWWRRLDGASWKHPEGPGSNVKSKMNHPVVHVSWNDAHAFADYYGKRLPTEAEWEFAARGGQHQKLYPWGDELNPDGQHMCNIWQGKFPDFDSEEDGFSGTAPAKNYLPNDYGLYNLVGNVWEWQQDWFSNSFRTSDNRNNPKGPKIGTSKTIKGGSYLCHESYCNRYRVAARSANTPDSSTGNLGFRCVSDTEPTSRK